jgi:hypothetical protein
MDIIIKDSNPTGRSRTRDDERLRKEGWGSSFTSDEARDKCAFVERKIKKETGSDNSAVRGHVIDLVP